MRRSLVCVLMSLSVLGLTACESANGVTSAAKEECSLFDKGEMSVTSPEQDSAEAQESMNVSETTDELQKSDQDLYAVLLEQYENQYGKFGIDNSFGSPLLLTGVCYAALLDFDGNGDDEFLVVYEEELNADTVKKYNALSDPTYHDLDPAASYTQRGILYDVELWDVQDGDLTKVYEMPASFVHEGFNIWFGYLQRDGKYYLEKVFNEVEQTIYEYDGSETKPAVTLQSDFEGLDSEIENTIDGVEVSDDELYSVYDQWHKNTSNYMLNCEADEAGNIFEILQNTREQLGFDKDVFPEAVKNQIMEGDYLLPYSGDEILTEADIIDFSREDLQLAINEIYARHGLIFNKEENRIYFESKSWYSGTVEDQNDIMLTDVEKKNVDFLRNHQ